MTRYILNRDNEIIHDASNISEKCNTDQIRHRRVVTEIPAGYRKCRHCMFGNTEVEDSESKVEP